MKQKTIEPQKPGLQTLPVLGTVIVVNAGPVRRLMAHLQNTHEKEREKELPKH